LQAEGYYGLRCECPARQRAGRTFHHRCLGGLARRRRLGVRHVRERIIPASRLCSSATRGALVLKYALEEVERGEDLPSTPYSSR
jgi:hypothetical protein